MLFEGNLIKITDFSNTMHISNDGNDLSEDEYSISYMAPEIKTKQIILTYKADVFSIGLTFLRAAALVH